MLRIFLNLFPPFFFFVMNGFFMCVVVLKACMSVYQVSAMPEEARGGCWIPWGCNYRCGG